MMKFIVKLSDDAIDDMAKIRSYISYDLQNPDAALSRLSRIFLSVQKLADFPKLHRVRGKDRFGNELRIYPVDNYSVLYYVDEDNYLINISRVLYGRRNIDALP